VTPRRSGGLLLRLCPRRPTSPFDRVGKVARGQCPTSSAAAGTLPTQRGRIML